MADGLMAAAATAAAAAEAALMAEYTPPMEVVAIVAQVVITKVPRLEGVAVEEIAMVHGTIMMARVGNEGGGNTEVHGTRM